MTVVPRPTRRGCPSLGLAASTDPRMNRRGSEPEDLPDVDLTRLDPQLIISHLACADTPNHPQNAAQLARFRQATEGMPKDRLSLAATGGSTLGAEYHFALTRPGAGLYLAGSPGPQCGSRRF